jgi:hypothetical protein
LQDGVLFDLLDSFFELENVFRIFWHPLHFHSFKRLLPQSLYRLNGFNSKIPSLGAARTFSRCAGHEGGEAESLRPRLWLSAGTLIPLGGSLCQ